MLLRYHLRTLFSGWHAAALVVLAGTALLWPAGDLWERSVLEWLLQRSELFGPPAMMALTSGLLLVDGRVDERWGTAPQGFCGLFRQRWLLMVAYFALALWLFLTLGAWRLDDGFPLWRTLFATLVTALLFSLVPPLVQSRSGSVPAGWATGLALYFGSVTVAQFWCPVDSTYQLWLPFAGLSDAAPWPLVASKGSYALLAVALFRATGAALARPERLIGRDA